MSAVIYATEWCAYCRRAKGLLDSKGIAYEEQLVGEDIELDEVSEKVGRKVSTVPQIFLDGEYIGGYAELARHLGAPA